MGVPPSPRVCENPSLSFDSTTEENESAPLSPFPLQGEG